MSLRSQILALIAIPFIVLAFIGGLKGLTDFNRYRSARTIQSETDDALTLIKLVHYLQVERGQSAALISSAGTVFKTELKDTRHEVETALSETPAATSSHFPQLTKLPDMRVEIDEQRISTTDMASFYTGIIEEILTKLGRELVLQEDPHIAQIGSGLVGLITAKEAAGMQRAIGATGFGLGNFDVHLYEVFAEKGAVEAKFLDSAAVTLGEYLPELDFEKGLNQSGLPEIRHDLLEAGPNGTVPDITAQEWFTRATQWLTYLHDIEDLAAQTMHDLSQYEAQHARRALLITAAMVAFSLMMSSAIGLKLILTFTRQFGALQADLDRLAHKEFNFKPALLESKTEVGRLSRAMEMTREALEKSEAKLANIEQERIADRGAVIGKLDEHLSRLARRDLDCTIDERFPEEYEQLRQSFNTTCSTLKETVVQVVDVAESIRNGATEISQASDDLSNRTESQAATLEQTAAALEEMTVSIKSSADGARSVETIMNEARQEAETSGKVVKRTVSAMTEIEQSSQEISQIISVIDDIAFQTNLLALNAGVEAARAGEAGRGFAVVASEVRALAQRSSDAATEIKSLITDSTKHVENGVELVGQAGTALENIVERVNHISQLVTEIAEGSAEQSTGLGEINLGVTQLDQVTQQNAAMVEQATAAGHLLRGDAGKLADMVSEFNLGQGYRQPARRTPAAGADIDWAIEKAPEPVMAKVGGAKSDQWQDF